MVNPSLAGKKSGTRVIKIAKTERSVRGQKERVREGIINCSSSSQPNAKCKRKFGGQKRKTQQLLEKPQSSRKLIKKIK